MGAASQPRPCGRSRFVGTGSSVPVRRRGHAPRRALGRTPCRLREGEGRLTHRIWRRGRGHAPYLREFPERAVRRRTGRGTGYRRVGRVSPGTDGSASPREGLWRWGVMTGPRSFLDGLRHPQFAVGALIAFGTAGDVNRPRERRAGSPGPTANYRSRHALRAGAVRAGRTPGPAWRSRRPRSPGGPRRARGREQRGQRERAGERLEERDPATRHGPG